VCGPAVFAGYYNNPEANAKAFRDGWFPGFLYITGRASDMYISGGSNIYPREIEEKMLAHPSIAEVAILGVPDKMWGEVGVAVCVLHPNTELSEKELLGWMEGKVARYKLPKRIFFWEELPKSGYGKITKKILREKLDARGCLPLDQRSKPSA
jgi:acyl-CoA synthetase (AMP-forming)/AMP-acid ligase II